jgi:hypothetical protein
MKDVGGWFESISHQLPKYDVACKVGKVQIQKDQVRAMLFG